MIELWEKGKDPLGETTAIINCPKSGHITPDETNVNTYLEKDFLNRDFASQGHQWSVLLPTKRHSAINTHSLGQNRSSPDFTGLV